MQWAVIVAPSLSSCPSRVLLLVRRTRNLGVVVGLVFHAVLALDRTHQFFDFSSVLSRSSCCSCRRRPARGWPSGWVRSAPASRSPDERVPGVVHLVARRGARRRSGCAFAARRHRRPDRRSTIGWMAVAAVHGRDASSRRCGSSHQRPASDPRSALRPHHVAVPRWCPLLVFANGLTPYLELKTGYGWNMYANLRTVDGESNHLVVRRTLPLTDEQADLVRIIATDDPGLAAYEVRDYALTWQQFRIYLVR